MAKRLLAFFLATLMLLFVTAFAESSSVSIEMVNGTGARPTTTYNMNESVIPFAKMDWGMSFEDVINITNGQVDEGKTQIQQSITLPDLNGEQMITYLFQDNGLYRVSMTVLKGATSDNPALQDSFKSLYAIAKRFISVENGDNADICLLITNKQKYVYKTPVTDIVLGYFRNEKTFDASIVFSKPASFDEASFRNTNMFSATISQDGQSVYYDAMDRIHSFLTDYSSKNKTTNGCAFTSLIRMIGSEATSINSMPCYKLVFSYTGNVSPQNVKSFVFQIDDKMYQLIPSEGQTSINQFNEYARQFEFLIDNSNIVFMEALTATQKTVRVEIRGDGFVLSFDMPSKSKKMLTEDWSLFKKAGGAADVYLMHSGAQMNVR